MLGFLAFVPQRLSGMQRETNRNASAGSRYVHALHIPHGCTIPAGHRRTEHTQLESELVQTDVKDCETNSKAEDRRVSFPQRPGLTVADLHLLHTRMGQGVYLLTASDL